MILTLSEKMEKAELEASVHSNFQDIFIKKYLFFFKLFAVSFFIKVFRNHYYDPNYWSFSKISMDTKDAEFDFQIC